MPFNCPVCQQELAEQVGQQTHPNDPNYGVTMYCPSRLCPAQEVSGHGDNSKAAWAVIQQKFLSREDRK
jgi:hypothetical protein